jgi:hypothetical protein
MEKQHAILVAEELVRIAAEADGEIGKRLYGVRMWILDRIQGKPIEGAPQVTNVTDNVKTEREEDAPTTE